MNWLDNLQYRLWYGMGGWITIDLVKLFAKKVYICPRCGEYMEQRHPYCHRCEEFDKMGIKNFISDDV